MVLTGLGDSGYIPIGLGKVVTTGAAVFAEGVRMVGGTGGRLILFVFAGTRGALGVDDLDGFTTGTTEKK